MYNGAKPDEINVEEHLERINDNVKLCFTSYDKDGSGYLDYDETHNLLVDMNLHRQFYNHPDPAWAW